MNNDTDCNVELPSDNKYVTKCPLIYALEIIGQKLLLASTFGEISANYFTEFIPVYFSHIAFKI